MVSGGMISWRPRKKGKKKKIFAASVNLVMQRAIPVSTVSRVPGIVIDWNHPLRIGWLSRSGESQRPDSRLKVAGHHLGRGFYVTRGQQVLIDLTREGTIARVVNHDGSAIRPVLIRGRVTQWCTLLREGELEELDLSGKLRPGAPKYRFDEDAYECNGTVDISRGLDVSFCLAESDRKTALRIIPTLDCASSPSFGKVRTLHEHHGFLADDVTRESIYFRRNCLCDPTVTVGDLVQYQVRVEPPMAVSAGKKIAFAIRRVYT